MNAHPSQRFADLPPAAQAGILSNAPQFQRFAALRECCQIDSRNTWIDVTKLDAPRQNVEGVTA